MVRDRSFPPTILRWSELRHMARSPAHFRAAYLEPKGQSPAMRFGTLVHSLALGGDGFIVWEGGDRRGKAWEAFRDAHDDGHTLIVKPDEIAEAQRVVDALHTDPVAAPLLRGLHEQELEWTTAGRRCAGRVDVIGDGWVVDLKTTNDAEPGRFARSALRMAYHAQLAHYQDGARANGHRVDRGYIVSVETEAPFAVTVQHVTARALDEGRKLVRLWIERAIQCEAAGAWPGYVQSVVDLDVVEDAGLIIDGEVVAA